MIVDRGQNLTRQIMPFLRASAGMTGAGDGRDGRALVEFAQGWPWKSCLGGGPKRLTILTDVFVRPESISSPESIFHRL